MLIKNGFERLPRGFPDVYSALSYVSRFFIFGVVSSLVRTGGPDINFREGLD
jgi:hypothetical protein